MQDVKEAVWAAIKDNIIKKTWFKVFSVLFVILIGFVLYKAYFSPTITKGEIGNDGVWKEYDSLVHEFDDKSKTLDGIESDIEESTTSFDSREMETVINQFFITANNNNSDLFIASMNPEQIDEDFSKFGLIERIEKIDEVMKRISRNGQLDRVNVIRSLWVLESDAVRVVLDVYYKDLEEPVRLNMIIKVLEQYQFNASEGETIKLPYVASSVWDLIKVIEEK